MVRGVERNPVMVIVFSIITCGIYGIYWQYTVGKEINAALGREAMNPLLAILALIFYPILFYYVYLMDNALVELAPRANVQYESKFIIWLISMFFIGTVIQLFMVQTTLNEIWASNVQG